MFRSIEEGDLLAGRLDYLPIGFGSVTSIGGVGHYCVFHKLRAFKELLTTEEEKKRVDILYDYWQEHDTKSIYCRDILTEDTVGRFIDCTYPLMATARLSGMMLNYKRLMKYGLEGLKELLHSGETNEFLECSYESICLLQEVIEQQIYLVCKAKAGADQARRKDLSLMEEDLRYIKENKPATFHQALQLFWIYALW